MSEYFHVIEQSDKRIPERDGMALNNLFKKELGNYGLHPELAIIQSIGESAGQHGGLWSIDFALTEKQSPIYKVYFSPLNGHILRQMAGIIVTSSGVYVILCPLSRIARYAPSPVRPDLTDISAPCINTFFVGWGLI